MKATRRELLAGVGSAAALAAWPAQGAGSDADATALSKLDAIAEENIRSSPENATFFGRDVGALAPLRSQLTDRSAAGEAKRVARLRRAVEQLRPVRLEALSPAMRVNVEVVRDAYASALDGFAFGFGDVAVGSYRNTPYVVAQNVGAYLDVPMFLDSQHPLKTREDADAYVARLAALAPVLDGETARLRADRMKGIVAPDFLLDKTLAALALVQQGPAAGWEMIAPLAKRDAALGGGHVARAAAVAEKEVRPALARQVAELRLHRAKAGGDAGVWHLPRGGEYYAWALRAATTTRMSPDEVHAMGLEQLRDYQGQMEPILRGLGYTKGTVPARMAALARDPRFSFPDTDAGREEILRIMRDSLARMAKRTPELFSVQVNPNGTVKRQALAQEIGGAGAYGGPGTPDGRVPPTVWMNLRDTSRWTRYALPDLAFHEGIPGHGWQGQYNFKLPRIRSQLGFGVYKEGWALYSEQLADEIGVYETPVERLGFLSSMGFRAARLVVDSGIHAKRWSRAQAIAWFAENGGDDGETEIDRYCAWPGQACSYKVGHSHILALRAKAKAALGDRFDLRAFNTAVVSGGDVPMTVLDAVVAEHVAARRA